MTRVFFILCMVFLGKAAMEGNSIVEKNQKIEIYKTVWDTWDNIIAQEFPDLRFERVVLAQVCHETKGLTSKIYQQCKNCVGMKKNKRKYNIGTCRGHAWYKTHMDSLRDYAEWQAKYLPYYENKVVHRNITTEEEYIQFLSWIGYAEDSDYAKRITSWLQVLDEIPPVITNISNSNG